jgi:hypothetical protein
VLSSDFHCKENDGFWVVFIHPVMVFMESGSLFVESSMSCVYIGIYALVEW